MGIRPPDRRKDKYEFKINPEWIKNHFENQKPIMTTYYTDASRYFHDIEERTKAILDSQGVRMSQYSMYYNFARAVGRKIKYTGYAGSCLYTEITILLAIWENRGLDRTILLKILQDVFGIVIR